MAKRTARNRLIVPALGNLVDPDPLLPGLLVERDGWPWCEKCQRRVEHVTVEMPIIDFGPDPTYSYPISGHSGEKIITVECHGEKFTLSNWRGVVPGHKPWRGF